MYSGAKEADREVDVAIIGAGPCGLGAAWQLERHRERGGRTSYVLIDENPEVGGSAASVTTPEGFVFDYGGHVLFPHEAYTELADLLETLVDRWHESMPIRGVWLDGTLIPYPVQRNVHRLAPRKLASALAGLSAVSLKRRLRAGGSAALGDDLRTYLRKRFGRGLSRLVMEPINRKMWAHPPQQLGSDWAQQRSGSKVANVADVSVRQILRSMVTRRDNPGWNESTRVRYPAAGGTGAIWTRLGSQLPARNMLCGSRVVGIDTRQRRIMLQDGTTVGYRHVISSIPLDRLVGLLDVGLSPDVSGKLTYANAGFVGFGIRGKPPKWLEGVHSFHMPEPEVPCWRVSFPANFAPGNVPGPEYWSILCEISHVEGASYDLAAAAAQIEQQLRIKGILPSDSVIVSRWNGAIEHGYPVPFLGRDAVVHEIQSQLRSLDILSRGRFGGWKYEVSNQDHSFMQGVEAVNLVVRDEAEITYRIPELVN